MKYKLITAWLSLALVYCKSTDSVEPVHGQGLPGTWLLYEVGYSPGAGYIVDKIPAQPKQTLTFTADGHMQAQGDRLRSYQSFTTFRTDTVNSEALIHYAPVVDSNFSSERISLRGDTLRLSGFCIEGCHSAFVRIK